MRRFDKDISVVFPAHNESGNIEPCIIVAQALLQEFVRRFEIIVVDDGSTDDTGQRISMMEQRFPGCVRSVRFGENQGYGRAIAAGFAVARYDLLFFSDSDRQFDILNLVDLLDLIDAYDIVVGYRMNRQDRLMRKFLSWGYNHLVRMFFSLDVRDIDCAFKVFHRRVFDRIVIESTHYFLNTEILAKAMKLGMKVGQVGVAHFPRVDGLSKVGFGDIPRTLRELKRIRRQVANLPVVDTSPGRLR